MSDRVFLDELIEDVERCGYKVYKGADIEKLYYATRGDITPQVADQVRDFLAKLYGRVA